MRGGLAFTLLFVRTASAVTIALLLLGMLFEAYHRGGSPELGTVFGVIQGVLLSTLAYLFTTQAVDRAEAEVVAEVKRRGLPRIERGRGVGDAGRGRHASRTRGRPDRIPCKGS